MFFDLETTGIDPATDKIVEISALQLAPDGTRDSKTRRVNPGRPIPPEASAVHGILDDDVCDEPTFGQIARSLLDWIGDADLAGFNIRRFDVPLLERELREAGLDLRLAERRTIDAMTIFHGRERRDLTAAVRFYLDREHETLRDQVRCLARARERARDESDRCVEVVQEHGDLPRLSAPDLGETDVVRRRESPFGVALALAVATQVEE